jgi:hypothetical protein
MPLPALRQGAVQTSPVVIVAWLMLRRDRRIAEAMTLPAPHSVVQPIERQSLPSRVLA